MRTPMSAAVLLPLLACGEVPVLGEDPAPPSAPARSAPAEPPLSLLDPTAWDELDPAADPFDVPKDSGCLPGGYFANVAGVEVDTGRCRYLVLGQPLHTALRAGDVVTVSLEHLYLLSDEPAEGHAGVSIGGVRVLDQHVPIPAEPARYVVETAIDEDIDEGAQLVFHLHNHGANSWRLVDVRR